MDNILSNLSTRVSAQEFKDIMKNFMSATSDESRIAFMLHILKTHYIFPPEAFKLKTSIESTRLRNEGNQVFISKPDANEYVKAWELYSISIAFAPNDSEELALAFANRSAILVHLRKYSEALLDIERALGLNYPNHIKPKLLLRKIECLARLENLELSEVYEKTLLLLDEISLDDSIKETFKNKLRDASKLKKDKVEDDSNPVELPTIVPQNEIPCCSDALTVKYNDKFGRHVVATRRIKPGEILAVEKSYSRLLSIGNMYTHCAHCLEVSWASVPCENCVFVLYCSKNCKDIAWKKYHDIECPVTAELLNVKLTKQELFSLRLTILAVREFSSLEKLKAELTEVDSCKDPRTRGFSQDGKLDSNKCRSIYSLVRNSEKRTLSDFFVRTYNSALILYSIATCTAFLGETFKSNDFNSLLANKDVLFIGGLILRHNQIVSSSTHFYEEKRGLGFAERGIAAFPFHSFLNHSCDPNVTRYASKEHMLLYALYPIEKDTQIFDSYGNSYWRVPKGVRQSKLAENYYFNCECIACQKNWPIFSQLSSCGVFIKSDSDRMIVAMTLNRLVDYASLITSGKAADRNIIFNDLIKMIEVLVHYVHPLCCTEVVMAINTLKQLMFDKGNRFEVPKLKNV